MINDNLIPSIFTCAKRKLKGKNIKLIDLLDRSDFYWVILLSNAYIGTREIFNFEDVVHKSGDSVISKFIEVRKSGTLLEGEKYLPASIASVLKANILKFVWIRRNSGIFCVDFNDFEVIIRDDESLNDFEACSDLDNWYLRYSDDDALIFISAKMEIISALENASSNQIIKVNSDFLY